MHIKDFSLWGNILSADQVNHIYKVGREKGLRKVTEFDIYAGRPNNGLLMWYEFGSDDNEERFVDLSGNKRHSIVSRNVSVVVEDDASPSLIKQNRNRSRRPTDKTTAITSPVFKDTYDNGHVTSLLPRSDFQYTWIRRATRIDKSLISGQQRIYGYAPADGELLVQTVASQGSISLSLLSGYSQSQLDGFAIKYKINDGFGNSVTFQIVSDGSSADSGNTAVERDSGVFGGLHLQVAEGLKDAINASGLGITATRSTAVVNLVNDRVGDEGNQPITVETSTTINSSLLQGNVSGMAGGVSSLIPAIDFPTLSDLSGG